MALTEQQFINIMKEAMVPVEERIREDMRHYMHNLFMTEMQTFFKSVGHAEILDLIRKKVRDRVSVNLEITNAEN